MRCAARQPITTNGAAFPTPPLCWGVAQPPSAKPRAGLVGRVAPAAPQHMKPLRPRTPASPRPPPTTTCTRASAAAPACTHPHPYTPAPPSHTTAPIPPPCSRPRSASAHQAAPGAHRQPRRDRAARDPLVQEARRPDARGLHDGRRARAARERRHQGRLPRGQPPRVHQPGPARRGEVGRLLVGRLQVVCCSGGLLHPRGEGGQRRRGEEDALGCHKVGDWPGPTPARAEWSRGGGPGPRMLTSGRGNGTCPLLLPSPPLTPVPAPYHTTATHNTRSARSMASRLCTRATDSCRKTRLSRRWANGRRAAKHSSAGTSTAGSARVLCQTTARRGLTPRGQGLGARAGTPPPLATLGPATSPSHSPFSPAHPNPRPSRPLAWSGLAPSARRCTNSR